MFATGAGMADVTYDPQTRVAIDDASEGAHASPPEKECNAIGILKNCSGF